VPDSAGVGPVWVQRGPSVAEVALCRTFHSGGGVSSENGDAQGRPRPILTVQPNGSNDDPDLAEAVTVVELVIGQKRRTIYG
jgi:hypothetical protein